MDALSKYSSHGCQKLRNLITHFRPHTTAMKAAFQENAEVDILSQFAVHEFLLKVGARATAKKDVPNIR